MNLGCHTPNLRSARADIMHSKRILRLRFPLLVIGYWPRDIFFVVTIKFDLIPAIWTVHKFETNYLISDPKEAQFSVM